MKRQIASFLSAIIIITFFTCMASCKKSASTSSLSSTVSKSISQTNAEETTAAETQIITAMPESKVASSSSQSSSSSAASSSSRSSSSVASSSVSSSKPSSSSNSSTSLPSSSKVQSSTAAVSSSIIDNGSSKHAAPSADAVIIEDVMYNVKKYMVFDSKLKNEKPSEVFTYLVVNSGADPAEEMEGYFKECYDSGKKKFYIESGGMTTITNSVGSPLPAYKYNCYVK